MIERHAAGFGGEEVSGIVAAVSLLSVASMMAPSVWPSYGFPGSALACRTNSPPGGRERESAQIVSLNGNPAWCGHDEAKMALPAPVTAHAPSQASAAIIATDIPARLDRLRWGRFHTLVVVALGITWILDGLE